MIPDAADGGNKGDPARRWDACVALWRTTLPKKKLESAARGRVRSTKNRLLSVALEDGARAPASSRRGQQAALTVLPAQR